MSENEEKPIPRRITSAWGLLATLGGAVRPAPVHALGWWQSTSIHFWFRVSESAPSGRSSKMLILGVWERLPGEHEACGPLKSLATLSTVGLTSPGMKKKSRICANTQIHTKSFRQRLRNLAKPTHGSITAASLKWIH